MKYELRSPHSRTLVLGETTKIMGILNVTPDSFYDGGKYSSIDRAVARALAMAEEGASIIDIGGESTRPGAEPVPSETEMKRVLPVIQEIRKQNPDIFISIDTYKSQVAKAAIEMGADMVNDISGLSFDPEMMSIVLKFNLPVVVMHIKGTPRDMQKNPFYFDVIDEISRYLLSKKTFLLEKGIPPDHIILDPGIGFGKRLEDNIEIFKNIGLFKNLGSPLLVGHSRKSMIGMILDGITPDERLEGTLALTAYLFMKGVELVRVHDVKENYRVIKTLEGLKLKLYDKKV